MADFGSRFLSKGTTAPVVAAASLACAIGCAIGCVSGEPARNVATDESTAPAASASSRPAAAAAAPAAQAPGESIGVVRDPSGAAVTFEALAERASRADFVLLGEVHDNPWHHRGQAEIVGALGRAGKLAGVVMEHIDPSQRDALERHRASNPDDAAGLGAAVGWAAKGWPDWAMFVPLAAEVVRARVPLVPGGVASAKLKGLREKGFAAEFSAEEIRRTGLEAPMPHEARAALEKTLVESHCGHPLPPARMEAMVRAQRTWDARLALALEGAAVPGKAAVLVAGTGHTWKTRAVPVALERLRPRAAVVVVAFAEEGNTAVPAGEADFVWTTPRAEREDPCAAFRKK